MAAAGGGLLFEGLGHLDQESLVSAPRRVRRRRDRIRCPVIRVRSGPDRHIRKRHNGSRRDHGRVLDGGEQRPEPIVGPEGQRHHPRSLVVDALGNDHRVAAFAVGGQRMRQTRGIRCRGLAEQLGAGDDHIRFHKGEQRRRIGVADETVDADDLARRPGAGNSRQGSLRASGDGIWCHHHDVAFQHLGGGVVDEVDEVEVQRDQQRKDLGHRLSARRVGEEPFTVIENGVLLDHASGTT